MDLSFTPDEAAFAADVREWLHENVVVPPRFETIAEEVEFGRAWQARLAEGHWVGIHWPESYGGRGASPVEVAIFNMEYARSRALQPINRVGINLAGPTLLAHGTDDQKQRWLPAILTADEIWCQLFSEPDAGSDLASLQTKAVRVDDGWLLSGQKVWTSYAAVRAVGDLSGPHRPRGAQAQGDLVPRRRHGSTRYRGAPAGADHRRRRVQRGVLRRGVRPRRSSGGRAAQRLGGREHDARARAGNLVPVQGTSRARGVPRRVVATRVGVAARSTMWRLPMHSPSRSWSCACCDCTTGARSPD